METNQVVLTDISDIDAELSRLAAFKPDLVMVFGAVSFFESSRLSTALQWLFPGAAIAGCSTAGEIAMNQVHDNSCVVTAVKFERTHAAVHSIPILGMHDSFGAGERLGKQMPADELAAVIVLGTGVAINGSALVSGLRSALPGNVSVSGGLAADGGAFKQTWTLGPYGPASNQIVAVGLYGKDVRLGYGSFAGWEPFGPARKVTRCNENVLYELDEENALDIYKRYLGEYAKTLPASGLLFPFEMLGKEQQKSGVFRTILGVDEAEGSLTLAGDIDPDGYLKLMHSSTEKLILGAETAAKSVLDTTPDVTGRNALAILVSCVGRKLVMGNRVDEEVKAVATLLGRHTRITGFYSNGEIAPSMSNGESRLHNQTMTITWISED